MRTHRAERRNFASTIRLRAFRAGSPSLRLRLSSKGRQGDKQGLLRGRTAQFAARMGRLAAGLGPKSRPKWAGLSFRFALETRALEGYARFRALPHAAFPSPRTQIMPHRFTERGQVQSISAPEGPFPEVFSPPRGPRTEYFCTGEGVAKRDPWQRGRPLAAQGAT